MKKQLPTRCYFRKYSLSTVILASSVSTLYALTSSAFAQTQLQFEKRPITLQQQQIKIDHNFRLQEHVLDFKHEFDDRDRFVSGETELQPGANKLPNPEVAISMDKPEAVKVGRPSSASRGGMLNTDSIKIYMPQERYQNGAADLQRTDIRVADGKGDQQSKSNGSVEQHVRLNFVIEGTGIYVQDITTVPSSVQTSRYLQGPLVWQATLNGKPIAVGSLSDPRRQHSLIRGKHDAEEPAPGLAEKSYFSIPLDEKYLGSNYISEVRIEFFTLDPTVPTNTELSIRSFEKVISQTSEFVGSVEGSDLYVAAYDRSNSRRK